MRVCRFWTRLLSKEMSDCPSRRAECGDGAQDRQRAEGRGSKDGGGVKRAGHLELPTGKMQKSG
jgi:hypothetical protein